MSKSQLHWVIFCLGFILSACTVNKKESLSGTWLIYKIDTIGAEKEGFDNDRRFSTDLKKGIALYLFDDHLFTEINSDTVYRFGHWKVDSKDNLLLIDNHKNTDSLGYSIGRRFDQKPILTLFNANQHKTYTYLKQFQPLKSFKDDPFYPDNNHWRLKPTTAEDTSQLTKRLLNYLKHLALIMNAAKERNLSVVSFQSSMGPVKIYNGGIGIVPFEFVSNAWKETYYDSSNARIAYNLFKDYLGKNRHYEGAMTGDWVLDDYHILLSIYTDLSKPK